MFSPRPAGLLNPALYFAQHIWHTSLPECMYRSPRDRRVFTTRSLLAGSSGLHRSGITLPPAEVERHRQHIQSNLSSRTARTFLRVLYSYLRSLHPCLHIATRTTFPLNHPYRRNLDEECPRIYLMLRRPRARCHMMNWRYVRICNNRSVPRC